MFATRYIARGTRILSDAAIVQTARYKDAKDETIKEAYRTFTEMDPVTRKRFLRLRSRRVDPNNPMDFPCFTSDSTSSPEDMKRAKVMCIILINGMFIESTTDGHDIEGVFPIASRINHSCLPNVHWTFNKSINRLTVHAVRDINPDEEIEGDYIGGCCLPLRFRTNNLAFHRFLCRCAACYPCPCVAMVDESRRQYLHDLEQLRLNPNIPRTISFQYILEQQVQALQEFGFVSMDLAHR